MAFPVGRKEEDMTKTAYTGPSFTTEQIADNLAEVQFAMYEHFSIDGLPNDKTLLQEMREWAADQLRKAHWFDLIDESAIGMADEEYNAHFIADVATNEIAGGR